MNANDPTNFGLSMSQISASSWTQQVYFPIYTPFVCISYFCKLNEWPGDFETKSLQLKQTMRSGGYVSSGFLFFSIVHTDIFSYFFFHFSLFLFSTCHLDGRFTLGMGRVIMLGRRQPGAMKSFNNLVEEFMMVLNFNIWCRYIFFPISHTYTFVLNLIISNNVLCMITGRSMGSCHPCSV